MIIGSSTYAFSIVVALFLIGLAGGRGLLDAKIDQRNCAQTILVVEAITAISLLLSLYVLNRIPGLLIRPWLEFAGLVLGRTTRSTDHLSDVADPCAGVVDGNGDATRAGVGQYTGAHGGDARRTNLRREHYRRDRRCVCRRLCADSQNQYQVYVAVWPRRSACLLRLLRTNRSRRSGARSQTRSRRRSRACARGRSFHSRAAHESGRSLNRRLRQSRARARANARGNHRTRRNQLDQTFTSC